MIFMTTSGDITHEPDGGQIRIDGTGNPLNTPGRDAVDDDTKVSEDQAAELEADADAGEEPSQS